jgi:hypothetical protein
MIFINSHHAYSHHPGTNKKARKGQSRLPGFFFFTGWENA